MRIGQTHSNIPQNSLLGPAVVAYLISLMGFHTPPRPTLDLSSRIFVCLWVFVFYLAFYHPKILWQGVPQSNYMLCEEPTIR